MIIEMIITTTMATIICFIPQTAPINKTGISSDLLINSNLRKMSDLPIAVIILVIIGTIGKKKP